MRLALVGVAVESGCCEVLVLEHNVTLAWVFVG
jgi:hypothetical protein